MKVAGWLVLLAASLHEAHSYLLPAARCQPATERPLVGRREALAAGAAVLLAPAAAFASGGATSGKTTSIPRAKLRYYDRVTVAVAAFAAAVKAGAKGDFYVGDEGPYEELKSAGYLLAVAFKIDSKIPPDKIAAVKAWKAMMKDLDGMKSAKGDKFAAAATKASTSMNAWLEEVELPPLGDARYA